MDDYRKELEEDEEPIELFEVNLLNTTQEVDSRVRRNYP
jgi:hypothetical protein